MWACGHVMWGGGVQWASVVIFFISAVLHELIVSIPFRNFKLLAFGGMMAQVPPPAPRASRSPAAAQRSGGRAGPPGARDAVACPACLPQFLGLPGTEHPARRGRVTRLPGPERLVRAETPTNARSARGA